MVHACFEARHKYFKDLARVIKNVKNLPYSLSMRYQSRQFAYNIGIDDISADSGPLNNEEYSFGTAEQVSDNATIKYIRESLQRFHNINYSQNEGLYTLKGVTIHGTLYKPGFNTYLLANAIPEFGRLMKIWYVHGFGVFLSLHIMDTVRYSDILSAYELKKPDVPHSPAIWCKKIAELFTTR